MFLLLHGIGDYMALEEDNWSQQAVGISLNPGDMLLQLAPNVFCFWSDSLKTLERKGGVKTVSKKTVLYHTRFASRYEPGLRWIKHFSHPEFCVPAKYLWQMQFLS